MKCQKCEKEFRIGSEIYLAEPNGDAAQVLIACTHCDARYYDFTSGQWTLDDDFNEAGKRKEGK